MTLILEDGRRDSDSDLEDRSPLDGNRDIEAPKAEASQKKALIKKKQDTHAKKSWFGRSVAVVETRLQCPAVTCACVTGVLGIICIIGSIVAFVFAGNTAGAATTETTYTISDRTIAYIVGGVAGGVAIFLVLNSFTHIFSCCTIGRYIPEKAFEDNIGMLHLENEQLTITVDQLKEELKHWKDLVTRLQDYVNIQKKLTNNLRDEFSQQEKKLSQVHSELNDNVAQLNHAKEAMKAFEGEIAKTHAILNQLAGSNRQFGQQLQALGVTTKEMEDQQVEWNKDTQVLAGENDEFEQHNKNLQNLGQMLAQQLTMMEQFRNAIADHSDKITRASVVLDESDDKFIAANKTLKETVEARENQLREMRETYDNLKNTLALGFEGLLKALENVNDKPEVQEAITVLKQIIGDLSARSSGVSSS